MLSAKLIQTIVLASLVLLLVLSLFLGIRHGRSQAESTVTASNSQQINNGLRYFFADNDRFPSVAEFSDRGTMLNYFTSFPPHQFAFGKCSQSLSYQNLTSASFVLQICIPSSAKPFKAGLNQLTQ